MGCGFFWCLVFRVEGAWPRSRVCGLRVEVTEEPSPISTLRNNPPVAASQIFTVQSSPPDASEREFVIGDQLVRIHLTTDMILVATGV